MADEQALTRFSIVKLLIKPIAAYCLRNSYPIQDFIKSAKLAFIECAEEELKRRGDKPNPSRMSAMTGLYRQEVAKLYHGRKDPMEGSRGVLWKVIGTWEQSPMYTTKSGKPKVLAYEGENSEFHELVRSVSKTISAGTILYELERAKSVKKTRGGLKLVLPEQFHGGAGERSYELLARDMDSLANCIEENIVKDDPISNMHITTQYDNIFEDSLSEIKEWMWQEGRAFHRRARAFLAKHDRDVVPQADPKRHAGKRVRICSFGVTDRDINFLNFD
ncbi:MAG: hypothetical protein KDD66_12920 [Bdellovibrionales bacterium]|nr:hypothetical protein [Bdellovibrionales bacterium]